MQSNRLMKIDAFEKKNIFRFNVIHSHDLMYDLFNFDISKCGPQNEVPI